MGFDAKLAGGAGIMGTAAPARPPYTGALDAAAGEGLDTPWALDPPSPMILGSAPCVNNKILLLLHFLDA